MLPQVIDVKGQLRPTRNSRGLLIHPSLEGIRSFWSWFEDSVLVDRCGRPVVLFHQTATVFESFDTRRGDLGSHFGTISQAHHLLGGTCRPGMHLLPVYLDLQNPITLRDKGGFHADAVAPQLRAKKLIDVQTADRLIRAGDRGTVAERRQANDEIKQRLVEAGFDGVVYTNTHEGGGHSYIAFAPTQIKSALGNSGAFDPMDADFCCRQVAVQGAHAIHSPRRKHA